MLTFSLLGEVVDFAKWADYFAFDAMGELVFNQTVGLLSEGGIFFLIVSFSKSMNARLLIQCRFQADRASSQIGFGPGSGSTPSWPRSPGYRATLPGFR
jgi:hypothetical protein